jgi:hypothetical protein
MEFPAMSIRDGEANPYLVPHGLPGGPHVIIVAIHDHHQETVDEWKPHVVPPVERREGSQAWEIIGPAKGYPMSAMRVVDRLACRAPDSAEEYSPKKYESAEELAGDLGLDSLDEVHVYVVDPDRRVLAHAEGSPTDESIAEITAALGAE